MPEGQEPQQTETRSKKPANTAFKQQRLKAWQPILTPKTVLPTFFIIGIVFIPIGAVLLNVSNSVQEIVFDYTDCRRAPSTLTRTNTPANVAEWAYNPVTNICTIAFDIPTRMEPPVFLYYRLTNFYQNHRRYVKSLSTRQLKGEAVPGGNLASDCQPLDKNGNRPYYPCGLIANSFFNDTLGTPDSTFSNFAILDNSGNRYAFSARGITWPSDAQKYGKTSYNAADISPPKDWIGGKYRNFTIRDTWEATGITFDPSDDEQFQVWMRTAGLPTFRKLYGKNTGVALLSGRYTIQITDNFQVTSFGGTKSIVLSTSSWLGGKNSFLGIAYLVVGCLCVLLGVAFALKHMFSPRKLGDHTFLSWNQPQAPSATPAASENK